MARIIKQRNNVPGETCYFDWWFGKFLSHHCGPCDLGLCNCGGSVVMEFLEALQNHGHCFEQFEKYNIVVVVVV